MKIRITNIDWDTDGKHVSNLPIEILVDFEDEFDPEQEIADWLSDHFGWLVHGANYEEIEEPSNPSHV